MAGPLAGLPLLLCAAQPAAAESDAIIVTAARTADATETLGGAVIDEEEIEILQPVSTLDLLDRVSGVRAFEKGRVAGPSYVSIRGGEPNFTLVLLDGIRVNDPTNSRGGAFDFGQIDPFALERIEIARGALSAVHGADALSGVINLRLRTLDADERLLAGRAFADTRGGLGASATAGQGWKSGSLLASGSWYDSGELTQGSDLRRWQLFGRARQELGPVAATALALHARTDRAVFPEDSGGPRLAVIREPEQRQTDLTIAGLALGRAGEGQWQPRLSLSWVRQDDDAATPAIAPGEVIGGVPAITADSRFERAEATFENRLDLGETADLAVGAAWLREHGRAVGNIDFGVLIPADFDIEREVLGAFAEAAIRPAPWASLILGARFDDPSSHSAEWTGRAALRLTPFVEGPAVFASWAEGYKLPSLYALAYPIIANPDLRPERSQSYELGVEERWSSGRSRVRLAYFHSRYRDLIDFDPKLFTNVNRSGVTAQGVEAELAFPLSSTLDFSGNITYLHTSQPDDAAPLRSRPEWQGLAALDWRPSERAKFYLGAAYTGAFFDSSVPTGLVTLDPRLEITAGASVNLSDRLRLALTAHNLLSDRNEDAVGFPSPGRVLRASLSLRR